MEKVKISVGDKKYNVSIADTEELREVGLQNVSDLPEEEGMLFIFEEADEVSI
jgi:uncharacterized membrane protein (UPF0127 family)